MKYIFEVEDVFNLTNRGCVLAPGVSSNAECPVLVGSKIVIVRPDGSELETKINGIEIIRSVQTPVKFNPILLPRDIEKSKVPIGSKVYLLNE
ncbi:hypothetical protein [Microbulbifer thermotolerans]|uniref:Uncharacterized protein n=1 Tax=Microbulbifer thermotolerans TaxID=252514 RepID=A0AB35I3T2_MICTH|nr:hypothetical protein [Microbulbifer thermotolerans]MCX2796254.1 hypothetical protein [Microbulbifer thermotolerans]MCX2803328.1 hypothetical protein [Microbulbifer thermotolerans]